MSKENVGSGTVLTPITSLWTAITTRRMGRVLADPRFRKQTVKPLKGKGSYRRKKKVDDSEY